MSVERLRVLQVHNQYRNRGGEDTVVHSERQVLSEAGHDVTTVRTENPPGLAAIGSLLRVPWNRSAAERTAEAAAAAQPDVIHVHNTWFELGPAVFPALAEVAPVVWTAHNYRIACANSMLLRDGMPCTDCVGATPWPAVRHVCYRDPVSSAIAALTIQVQWSRSVIERSVDTVLALTGFAKSVLVEAGLDERQVVVKPNFVEGGEPRSSPPSRSDFVLFVGRLSAEKGVGVLAETWRRGMNHGLRLVAVGDGPEAAMLEGIADVEVRGWLERDAVADLMRHARALVFPSVWFEGQPMVLIEALAGGLPLIGSDLGAIPELVAASGFDGVFAAGDVEQLSRRLASLEDAQAVDSASQLARDSWREKFAPAVGLRSLERVYRAAITG